MRMWVRVVDLYLTAVLPRPGTPGRRPCGGEAGQSMVEYAIVAALIAVVAMAAVQALGVGVVGVFQAILGKIAGLGGG